MDRLPGACCHLLSQFDVPVGEIDEVAPTVVGAPGKGDVDERAPLWTFRFLQERHPGLVGKPVSLARIARDAGTDDVFPCGQTSPVPR